MTNQIALYLVVLFLVALGSDMIFNDSAVALIFAKKLFELIEWVAFWR